METLLSFIAGLILLMGAVMAGLAGETGEVREIRVAGEINPICAPTKSDSLGPFFIANTPVVTNLNRFGKPGEAMRIVGKVVSASPPYTPIAGARLEIWQTDGTGNYHPQANGDYSEFDDREIDMRGTVLTDEKGEFSVLSLVTHGYGRRPPHIHYKISANGYKTLITQHYLDVSSRDRCRTSKIDRTQKPARFNAPLIYLKQLAPSA